MKTLLRILKWTGICLAVLLLIIFIAGIYLYNKTYDAPYPEITASADSAVIAHGKHLVFSTAHCVVCHFRPGDSTKMVNGEELDLAGGGFPFEFPGGKFYSRNISSDKETGIGKYTDGQIARTLRYGVKPDGTALIPAMEFQNLSDEDIAAIISYLRTTRPVSYKIPENDFNLFGKAVIAFFIRPESPAQTPSKRVEQDTSAAYGLYLAKAVCDCRGCHTQRSKNTGEYIGEELAGGPWGEFIDEHGEKKLIVAPNLTPDPETGKLANWTFDQFKTRFQQGRIIPQSPMPWNQFRKMSDTELLSIWNYLKTVKPVHRDNGLAVQAIKE